MITPFSLQLYLSTAHKTSQFAYTVTMLLIAHEILHKGPGTTDRQLKRRVNALTQ